MKKEKKPTLKTVIHFPTGKVLYCVLSNVLEELKLNKNEIVVDDLLVDNIKYPYFDITNRLFYDKKPKQKKITETEE